MTSLGLSVEKLTALVGGGVLFIVAAGILYKKRSTAARLRKYVEETPRGTVLLHQAWRGTYAPSLSPFPIKLETYLRINNIPYKTDHDDPMGPKGKLPWMTYNGEHIADSQICIDLLSRDRDINMNAKYTAEQQASAHAIRCMLEDNLYWCVVRWRWTEKGEANAFLRNYLPLNSAILWIIKRSLKKTLYGQGTGRHTLQEVDNIAEKAIIALSDFLGTKKFLLGDDVCEEDCAVFGQLCQVVYQLPGTVGAELANGKCSNLKAYCERMQAAYWPDWEDCLKKDSKK